MKKLFLNIITLLLVLASCQDNDNLKIDTTSKNEVEVELNFTSPLTRSTEQRAETEKVIELDLVVCKDGMYQYTRQTYTTDNNVFRSYLKIEDDIDIYFFANCRSVIDTVMFKAVEDWKEIQPKLILNETETKINNVKVLPMWGKVNTSISDTKINKVSVELLRSVAAANVVFNLDNNNDFKADIIYIYNGADKGYAAPADDNVVFGGVNNKTPMAIDPKVPEGTTTSRKQSFNTTSPNKFEDILFMFDNDADITSTNKKYTRLVVGGYYKGSEKRTYYPLDFVVSNDNKLLRVKRNQQYNLTITSVNGEGFVDPDEAAKNASVNLEYTVVAWDKNDHDNIGIYGPDYLSLSKKKVTLYKNKGSKAMINMTGTFKAEDLALSFIGGNGNTTAIENGVKNNRFKAELTGADTDMTLTITALGDFSTLDSKENVDKLLIKAGGVLEFEISIEQINSRGWDNGGNNEVDF